MFPGDAGIVIGKSGSYLIIKRQQISYYKIFLRLVFLICRKEILKDLALKKHVSASTQNQALSALLFYFRFVKNTPVMEPA